MDKNSSRSHLVQLALGLLAFALWHEQGGASLATDASNGSLVANNEAFHLGDSHTMLKQLKNSANLAEITSSYNPNTPAQLEACENFFHRHDELSGKFTIADFGLMGLVAKLHASVYNDAFAHNYDSFTELKLAAGPQVDQELCLKQLRHLNARARQQEVDKYRSKDVNLYQLLDTFGHISSGLLLGNAFFEGMYHECTRLKIDTPDGRTPTRYCLATVKHIDWPKVDRYDIVNLKMAVCLPRACDSLNYKNKYELVMGLVSYQLRRVELGQGKVNKLYCLPSEDSPLRSISRAPSSLVTLVGLVCWILVQVYATVKYERRTRQQEKQSDGLQCPRFGLTNGLSLDKAGTVGSVERDTRGYQMMKIYKVLSISNNLRLLFDTTKKSSLLETGRKLDDATTGPQDRRAEMEAHKETNKAASISHESASGSESAENVAPDTRRRVVDLRCIEGIKVISMVYVIMGHVLMCTSSIITNGRELTDNSSVSFFVANLVPAFAVNSFFTITGLLTSYLTFKQNQSHSFITSPAKWLAFIIYRYLRLMPMYALIVLYTKTLAKFAGSGPLWDYGTSALAQRRACEQESWLWTLLFAANFKPPLQHCIPSAWYLANDFQFFIVTPVFLALLHRRPRLGQRILRACALLAYLLGVYSILVSDVDDLRPIARFSPHAFKTYISHFSSNYTRPYYRIPAYLIGLLIGYRLHVFETAKLEFGKGRPKSGSEPRGEPDWPVAFKRYAMPLCVTLIALCCITPVIGSRLPFNKLAAKIMVALVNNSYHVMFSLAVGLYILLATTGHGEPHLNWLLSAPFWKPLARLSLCAVLINVEVINYIVQSNTRLQYLTNQYQLSMNLLCISATYLASIVVCVLFEAPVRTTLNSLLAISVTSLAGSKHKTR